MRYSGDDLLEADGRSLLPHVIPVFLNTENGEAQQQRCQQGGEQGNTAIGSLGVAADGISTGGQQGNEHAGGSGANAGKEGSTGRETVPGVLIRPEGGHHAPVGNVVHGEGDGVHEVHHAEKDDEVPSLQGAVEGNVDHNAGQQNTNDQPRLKFAEPGAGALNDIAHDGVIEGIEDTGAHHDGGNGGQLGCRQASGKEHVGQDKIVE